jgi:hypothetical protein
MGGERCVRGAILEWSVRGGYGGRVRGKGSSQWVGDIGDEDCTL